MFMSQFGGSIVHFELATTPFEVNLVHSSTFSIVSAVIARVFLLTFWVDFLV